MNFKDRAEAGRVLGDTLEYYAERPDVVVLGLARGGVPVAYEVARKLKLPLDVFVVRKLGVPGHSELAMGAIATGGILVLNDEVISELGISQPTIEYIAKREKMELERRERQYRGCGAAVELRDKIVILVDDGLATGSTMRAAVRAVRQQEAQRIIVAVPAASVGAYARLKHEADEVIALWRPEAFFAVSQFYRNFSQTSDSEVTALLTKSRNDRAMEDAA